MASRRCDQNRSGELSPQSRETQADGMDLRDLVSQLASSNVFPAPGGPTTTVRDRATALARVWKSRGRRIVSPGSFGICSFDSTIR
jgi:hypothetical protein